MACVKREQRNDPFQNSENKETELNDKWEDQGRKDIQNTVQMKGHTHMRRVFTGRERETERKKPHTHAQKV